jgi:hypothetical protein
MGAVRALAERCLRGTAGLYERFLVGLEDMAVDRAA